MVYVPGPPGPTGGSMSMSSWNSGQVMWNCAGRVHVLVLPVTSLSPRIVARVSSSVNVQVMSSSSTVTCTMPNPTSCWLPPSHTMEVRSHADWPFWSMGAISWIWYVPFSSGGRAGSAGVGVFSATTFATTVALNCTSMPVTVNDAGAVPPTSTLSIAMPPVGAACA